ncbi:type II toxin-antitoxin system RelE/ParE family toxin [Candidatus Woesearchaeota archaeon]|nr:type II toxin-antitoxin system RelE/ParE family toxin [Candidatus Woesearchaeota archaeon]
MRRRVIAKDINFRIFIFAISVGICSQNIQISNSDSIILQKLRSIRENPFHYLKRLQGEKLWRLRISDYRVIIDVVVSINSIFVVRIGNRKNVYD